MVFRMIDVDTIELKGKRFRCIEGCGLCCLCQPELMPSELKAFRRDSELANVVVKSSIDPAKRSIRMLPRGGPCSLLADRRCTIYDRRPHFCRQFPVHTHLMWRIQLTPDYSCRGIWRDEWGADEGELTDLEQYGLKELHRHSPARLDSELRESNEVFEEFRGNALESRVWRQVGDTREKAISLIDGGFFSSISGLGRVLTATERSREHGLTPTDAIHSTGEQESTRAARDALNELAEELLSVRRPDEHPVYVDRELAWNTHVREGSHIVRRRLLDKGGFGGEESVELDPAAITLSRDGETALEAYARVTNRRDAFLGFVYYLVDDADYEADILSTYLENLAMTQLDLVFRSALAVPSRSASMGGEEIAEGIVYIDMDMHDAPTIGSVI